MSMKIKGKQSQRLRLKTILLFAATAASVFLIVFSIAFITGNLKPESAVAGMGMHGAKTIAASNVILNEFTALNADVSATATQITVVNSALNTNGRFPGNLSAGELVLIVQMQGASISTSNNSGYGAVTAYNNSGKYEFNTVASVPNSTKINFTCPLKNSYTKNGKTQVMRVPRYTNFVINAGMSVTTEDWNGTTGGIVAIEVLGTTTINGVINVNGKGFRGGAVENSCIFPALITSYVTNNINNAAEKGEGIAGSVSDYDAAGGRYGRGAPANGGGGGNAHNSSGGGGANAGSTSSWDGLGNPDNSVANWVTAWNLEGGSFSSHTSSGGGRGGYAYSQTQKNPLVHAPGNTQWTGDNRLNNGGLGGRPLNNNSGQRIFMGGGGGAGDSNNNNGTSGTDGGGIVFICSNGAVSGSGIISANGLDGGNTVKAMNGDGSGGGGGGGTIIIYTDGATVSGLTLNARGGVGGNQSIDISNSEAEGTGGGGGGGYIRVSNPVSLTRNVNGGNAGTSNSISMTTFLPNGGTRGGAGTIEAANPPNPYCGVSPLPVTLTKFEAEKEGTFVEITWTTASEENNDFFNVERSGDGKNFEAITKIKGAGNSTIEREYSFTDKSPLGGNSFYRLSQTDFNGKHETFNPVRIKFEADEVGDDISVSSVYPNPFTEKIKVVFNSATAQEIFFTLTDANGRLIKKENTFSDSGTNELNFQSLHLLNRGVYYLTLSTKEKKVVTVKVMKI